MNPDSKAIANKTEIIPKLKFARKRCARSSVEKRGEMKWNIEINCDQNAARKEKKEETKSVCNFHMLQAIRTSWSVATAERCLQTWASCSSTSEITANCGSHVNVTLSMEQPQVRTRKKSSPERNLPLPPFGEKRAFASVRARSSGALAKGDCANSTDHVSPRL